MLITGLQTLAFTPADEALAQGTQSLNASCGEGGIESASMAQATVPAGLQVRIQGHASVPGASIVSVCLNETIAGYLPVDSHSGDFQGTVTVPADSPDGSYSFELIADPCTQARLLLCIGDSVAEGSFATSKENTYASRLQAGLQAQFGESSWNMQVYGVSGYGSLILDDVFNTPFYQNRLNPPPYFGPRSWWKWATPDLVVIELGVNNLPGLDSSYRYDGVNLRGYDGDDEAISWWKQDVTRAVGYLTLYKGVPASHILVLGQWPFGSATSYRGERYFGGTSEGLFNRWNTEMQSQAAALGATFVPMADVYGPNYVPDETAPNGDPDHLVDHDHGDSNVHPNDRGMALFADRILREVPADANGGSYSVPFDVRAVSPFEVLLTLSADPAYWASFDDYLAGRLSVDFTVTNVGNNAALSTQLGDGWATNGVIPLTEMPYLIGDIEPAGQPRFTVEFAVPSGVSSFRTTLAFAAMDTGGWVHQYP